jgi:hypothetical protein
VRKRPSSGAADIRAEQFDCFTINMLRKLPQFQDISSLISSGSVDHSQAIQDAKDSSSGTPIETRTPSSELIQEIPDDLFE